jgi:hypothetical protein
MRVKGSVLALVLVLGVGLSCKLAERLGGDKNAGTVSTLWSDVPPFEGAVKADLEIPLGARLIIRAFSQGAVNFISFKTSKTAQEVKDFYTNDRMKNAGWTPHDKGCVGDTEDSQNHGGVCLFEKKAPDKQEMLAIVIAQDEKSPETNIFYARIDTTQQNKK